MCFGNRKVGYIYICPRVFDSGTILSILSNLYPLGWLSSVSWALGWSTAAVFSRSLLETVFEMSRDLLIGDGQVNVNVGGNDRWPKPRSVICSHGCRK